MFVIELGSGWFAGSLSLWADALDFAGDAVNYGLALLALGWSVAGRNRLAWWKGWVMMAWGLILLGQMLWRWQAGGGVPHADTMSVIGALALLVNVLVAWMLYRFRNGDANLRAVWLCSRNDALGNLAILVAAAGVWGANAAWPDLAVAGLMAVLAVQAGSQVMKLAKAGA
jgi:Co/Zn/Cd efflux system component